MPKFFWKPTGRGTPLPNTGLLTFPETDKIINVLRDLGCIVQTDTNFTYVEVPFERWGALVSLAVTMPDVSLGNIGKTLKDADQDITLTIMKSTS